MILLLNDETHCNRWSHHCYFAFRALQYLVMNFIFRIHYCLKVYREVVFIVTELRTWVLGHLTRTCLPSIHPTQLGQFHSVSNSCAIPWRISDVRKGMCRFTNVPQMASHVSNTSVISTMLCAVLAENARDLKVTPVERNLQTIIIYRNYCKHLVLFT
jgi:hypothetical protein